ncbi:MAG: glutamine synthetase family protein [Thiolinea sp.]
MSELPATELDAFIADLNGQLRGKRVPGTQTGKILREGFKMPRSAVGLDIWGDDVLENGLVFETGDNDGICLPVTDQAMPIPWLDGEHLQLQTMMHNQDGSPFNADPRQLLKNVCERYAAHGLMPVVATELEFYLLPESRFEHGIPYPAPLHLERPDAYSIRRIDIKRELLEDIRYCCEVQDIPADAITSELGHGQFEINLHHVADPLLAADHALLFKRLIKGVADKHEHRATFMAKPFGERSGNGMHLHFSLEDGQGRNIFDNGTDDGSEQLQQAIAGLLLAMPESMLIFAPHLNSYRRLLPGSHAPVYANWGYENRTVSVRVPDSPNAARRIEHRVSGADANPYLVLAVVLAAALHGIENRLSPPEPIEGDAYAADDPGQPLPTQWQEAIDTFEQSQLMEQLLGKEFMEVFTAMKRQEYMKLAALVTPVEYQSYW